MKLPAASDRAILMTRSAAATERTAASAARPPPGRATSIFGSGGEGVAAWPDGRPPQAVHLDLDLDSFRTSARPLATHTSLPSAGQASYIAF
jgi:hypothetical protein